MHVTLVCRYARSCGLPARRPWSQRPRLRLRAQSRQLAPSPASLRCQRPLLRRQRGHGLRHPGPAHFPRSSSSARRRLCQRGILHGKSAKVTAPRDLRAARRQVRREHPGRKVRPGRGRECVQEKGALRRNRGVWAARRGPRSHPGSQVDQARRRWRQHLRGLHQCGRQPRQEEQGQARRPGAGDGGDGREAGQAGEESRCSEGTGQRDQRCCWRRVEQYLVLFLLILGASVREKNWKTRVFLNSN